MELDNLGLLLELTKKTGLTEKTLTSTAELSLIFGVSQQTVSRKLRELENQGFIQRTASPKGVEISLSDKGKQFLEQAKNDLNLVFSASSQSFLEGKLVSGLGEGTYYVSQPGYLKQFMTKLNFTPFLGTLNLEVNPAELSLFLSKAKPIIINSFKSNERTFGALKAFKILFNNSQQAALILPERTTHRNIAEIIAPVSLRKKFSLKDGDKIKIFLEESK